MFNLELERPHGFLIWKNKQTAIANEVPLPLEPFVITSDGEAYGIVTMGEYKKYSLEEFDKEIERHRTRVYERKLMWPEAEKLYIQDFEFEKFEQSKAFYYDSEGNVVIEEYEPSKSERAFIDKAKELPNKIVIVKNAVQADAQGSVLQHPIAEDVGIVEMVQTALSDLPADLTKSSTIDLYDISLTRTPNMNIKQGFVPPLYHDATAENSCGNCVFNKDTVCTLYDVYVEDHKLCDNWDPKTEFVEEVDEVGQLISVEEILRLALEKTVDVEDDQVLEVTQGQGSVSKAIIKRFKKAGEVINNALSFIDNDKQFQLDGESGFGVKETIDGPIFYTWSSNGFEDRENDIISTAALERYVAENEDNEFKGYFNYWHIPGTDFATKKFQAVIGRFLIEGGPFLDNELGRAAQKFFEENPKNHFEFAPEGWGASIEYKYLPEELWDKIFDWVWITRTSVLPKSAAANINTMGGLKMAKKQLNQSQQKLGEEMFGEDLFNSIVDQATEQTEILERETNFKEIDTEQDESESVETTEEEIVEETEPAEKEAEEVVEENVDSDEAPVAEDVEVETGTNDEPETSEDEGDESADENAEDKDDTEAGIIVEDVVKTVVGELTSGLKEELEVIAQIPEALKELTNRVSQLEKDAQIKQVSQKSRFSLFDGYRASTSVTESDENLVKESEVQKQAPKETQSKNKSAASHFFKD